MAISSDKAIDPDQQQTEAPDRSNQEDSRDYQQIPVDTIIPNRFQPREHFDEEAHQELMQSVAEHGVLEPLLVRPIDDSPEGEDIDYELIAGERRWRAATGAGLQTVPAIVRNMDDQETAEVALMENFQREDLSPIEEAEALNELSRYHSTQRELADAIGCSPGKITQRLKLLDLPEDVRQMVIEGKLTATDARELLKYKDAPDHMVTGLAEVIVDEDVPSREIPERTADFFNQSEGMKPITDRALHHDKTCLFEPDPDEYDNAEEFAEALGDFTIVETPSWSYVSMTVDWTPDIELWDKRQAEELRNEIEKGEMPSYVAGKAINAMEDPSDELEQLVEDYQAAEEDEDKQPTDHLAELVDRMEGKYNWRQDEVFREMYDAGQFNVPFWQKVIASGLSSGKTPGYLERAMKDADVEDPEEIGERDDFAELLPFITNALEERYSAKDVVQHHLNYETGDLGISRWRDIAQRVLLHSLSEDEWMDFHEGILEFLNESYREILERRDFPDDVDVPDDFRTMYLNHEQLGPDMDPESVKKFILEGLR